MNSTVYRGLGDQAIRQNKKSRCEAGKESTNRQCCIDLAWNWPPAADSFRAQACCSRAAKRLLIHGCQGVVLAKEVMRRWGLFSLNQGKASKLGKPRIVSAHTTRHATQVSISLHGHVGRYWRHRGCATRAASPSLLQQGRLHEPPRGRRRQQRRRSCRPPWSAACGRQTGRGPRTGRGRSR